MREARNLTQATWSLGQELRRQPVSAATMQRDVSEPTAQGTVSVHVAGPDGATVGSQLLSSQ